MLARLIRFSIDNAGLVLALALLVLGFAVYRVPKMPADVFPELNAPTVVVLTEAPGYAADEVEQYVTFPIESAVNGLPGVRRVRSASAIGLSLVWVDFDWGADIYRARYLVTERLTLAAERLPDDIHAVITPVTSITGEIMLLSLSSEVGEEGPLVDDLELRSFAEFELRNHILSVPGVSQVASIGGELPEYQINVSQSDLRSHDLTVRDVVVAARNAHSTAGAGYLPHVEGKEVPLRQTGRVRNENDIRGTLIRYEQGAPVTIGQVADVARGGAPRRGTAAKNGRPAVVLGVKKAPGTNTLSLTQAIDDKLDQVERSLPKGLLLDRHVMRQSDFINRSLGKVVEVCRDAAIIVAIILALFLLNARATLITLFTIPLSMAIAFLVLDGLGGAINVMTLGGLAIAIGEIVDDSIIDVENFLRRLRRNALMPPPERASLSAVVFDSSNEIRSSIVFATVIIVMVFVPLLFLSGLEGRFFRPLGHMYITSILASLLVALTITPALCRLLFGARSAVRAHRDGPLVRLVKAAYEPVLRLAVRFRRATLVGSLVVAAGAIALASSFGTSFLPQFNEGTFTVFLMAPPGTSLAESDRLARGVDKRLSEIDGVRAVTRRTGRAERDEHAEPVSSSEIEVTLVPGASQARVRAEIDRVLGAVPGITTMVGQPIEHRLSHVMSGTPAAVAINIFGDDLGVLRDIAKDVETQLKQLPGTRDVNAQREVMVTTLPIRYRPADLSRWGLTPVSAAQQVKAAIRGETITQINEGMRTYDLVVRLAPEQRETIDDVRNLLLRGEGGALVRLHEVADIGVERASNLIARENARRKAVVSANVAEGHNLGHLVAEIRKRVDPIVHAAGYTVAYGGQFQAQQSAARTIYIMGAGVAVLMLLLLSMALQSTRAAILVMTNLPLALIGGIAAIFLTASHDPFGNLAAFFRGSGYVAPVISIASMVGFVTLFGIAVRNGILMVNHYRYMMTHEGKTLDEAILLGSLQRLVPILMTALTAALGLVPLALAAGEPGSELLAPLAVVVLGGLLSSTFLNLVVIPAGYALVFRGSSRLPPLPSRETPESETSSP